MNPNNDVGILEIDLSRLEEEWARQPRLFYEWSAKLAEVRRDVEYAKAELKVCEAELDQDIRSNPAPYGLDKVTEPAVARLLVLQDEHKKATKKVIDLKYTEDMLQAMVTSLDHRKRALENEVDLHGQGYFATPRAPEHSSEQLQNSTAGAAMKRISQRLKKNPNPERSKHGES